MKISKTWVVLALFFLAASSCKKYTSPTDLATVIVVNAISNDQAIIPVFEGAPPLYYSVANTIGYGGYFHYTIASGTIPLYVTTIEDTSSRIYTGNIKLAPLGNYSFFLSPGDGKNSNGLLTRDSLPLIPLYDSSAGLRFVNLTPDSKPLSINLANNPPGQTEFSDLGYQQVTSFKKYPTNAAVGKTYTFEIRDQASGNLLTTYRWTYLQYFTNTLVLSGSVSDTSSTPLQVNLVKHY